MFVRETRPRLLVGAHQVRLWGRSSAAARAMSLDGCGVKGQIRPGFGGHAVVLSSGLNGSVPILNLSSQS